MDILGRTLQDEVGRQVDNLGNLGDIMGKEVNGLGQDMGRQMNTMGSQMDILGEDIEQFWGSHRKEMDSLMEQFHQVGQMQGLGNDMLGLLGRRLIPMRSSWWDRANVCKERDIEEEEEMTRRPSLGFLFSMRTKGERLLQTCFLI